MTTPLTIINTAGPRRGSAGNAFCRRPVSIAHIGQDQRPQAGGEDRHVQQEQRVVGRTHRHRGVRVQQPCLGDRGVSAIVSPVSEPPDTIT